MPSSSTLRVEIVSFSDMFVLHVICYHRLLTLVHMQMEGEGILVQAQNQKLHQELWQRQHEAVVRSQPEAAEAAAAAKQAAIVDLPPLTEQPDWIQHGQLYPHQLQVHSFSVYSHFFLSRQFDIRTISIWFTKQLLSRESTALLLVQHSVRMVHMGNSVQSQHFLAILALPLSM